MANFAAFAIITQVNASNLAVTGSAQNLTVAVSTDSALRTTQFRAVNSGTQEIFINVGSFASPPSAVTTSTFHFSMLPGTVEVFTWNPSPVLSVIAAATGSTIRVNPGEGI